MGEWGFLESTGKKSHDIIVDSIREMERRAIFGTQFTARFETGEQFSTVLPYN